MKTKTLILVFLIMAVLIITGSCATDKMAYISKDYEIYGTWTNPDAKPVIQFGKMVFNHNGKLEVYNTATSTTFMLSDFIITKKRIDAYGNI